MKNVMLPMKWRTLLKTVAKDGVFCSWVMRWELQKMLSWSHWQARWVWRLFYINDIIASLQKPKKQ
jgi:hypothetical protein